MRCSAWVVTLLLATAWLAVTSPIRLESVAVVAGENVLDDTAETMGVGADGSAAGMSGVCDDSSPLLCLPVTIRADVMNAWALRPGVHPIPYHPPRFRR